MIHNPKLALVVGGTSGLGLAVTQSLISHGYEVATVGRGGSPPDVACHYVCDIEDAGAWQRTLKQIKANHPAVAIAGFIPGFARAVDAQCVSASERQRHYRLNSDYVADAHHFLTGTLQSEAKLFTIGSQWSFRRGCQWLIPYMMAKQALCAITLELHHLPQSPKVRHYCVPTMNTPAFYKVRESFSSLGIDHEFIRLGLDIEGALPNDVSSVMIQHLIENDSDRSVFNIDAQLQVSASKEFHS